MAGARPELGLGLWIAIGVTEDPGYVRECILKWPIGLTFAPQWLVLTADGAEHAKSESDCIVILAREAA